jgi:hypothetical protein
MTAWGWLLWGAGGFAICVVASLCIGGFCGVGALRESAEDEEGTWRDTRP